MLDGIGTHKQSYTWYPGGEHHAGQPGDPCRCDQGGEDKTSKGREPYSWGQSDILPLD